MPNRRPRCCTFHQKNRAPMIPFQLRNCLLHIRKLCYNLGSSSVCTRTFPLADGASTCLNSQPNASARDSSLSDDRLLTDLPPGYARGFRPAIECAPKRTTWTTSPSAPVGDRHPHDLHARHPGRSRPQPRRARAARALDRRARRPTATAGPGRRSLVHRGRGPHRLEAARLAGLATVPCVILSIDSGQADALAEADNLRCGDPSEGDSDSRAASVEGFRQNLRRHMRRSRRR